LQAQARVTADVAGTSTTLAEHAAGLRGLLGASTGARRRAARRGGAGSA